MRILLVANKSWEADAISGVLRAQKARPAGVAPLPTVPAVSITDPSGLVRSVGARMAFSSSASTAELWCIQDLMDPTKSSSSSEEKARVLPALAAGGRSADVVVALGTAAFPDAGSYNGCVAVGSNVFVHNPFSNAPNPQSNWRDPRFDSVVTCSAEASVSQLGMDLRAACEIRFLRPPLNPASPPIILSSADFVAISNVNVTNYGDYAWADPEALAAFAALKAKQPIGSLETTHGLIRLVLGSGRFMFISGISDRAGYFTMEAAARDYAQNFVAAHNAGVALAWALPGLLS